MSKVVKKIELESNGLKRSFDFHHALRILILEKSKGKQNWNLTDKTLIFKDNEIIKRPDSGNTEKSN